MFKKNQVLGVEPNLTYFNYLTFISIIKYSIEGIPRNFKIPAELVAIFQFVSKSTVFYAYFLEKKSNPLVTATGPGPKLIKARGSSSTPNIYIYFSKYGYQIRLRQ